jgi:hypothetical protein
MRYCRCYFAAGGIGLILPLLNSEALPEYDGMRRLSLLAVRRASVISASNKYDDGKMDKFEESEIAADDNL